MAGQILADFGADVIRLEQLQPEMMRHIPPIRDGLSASFAQFNRNKRSIAVDIESEDGKKIAWSLIEKADVLIENFRPGVAEKIGFGFAEVHKRNHKLIYTSVNGFGATGPYAQHPAYDMVIQGLVGFMPIQGTESNPLAVKSVIVDKVTSVAAATAILAALLQRETDNIGQKVEVPMIDAYASVILPENIAPDSFLEDKSPSAPAPDVYRPLETKDGHLIGLFAQDHQFEAVCKVLDCTELQNDPRFSSAPLRFSNMKALIDELTPKTLAYTNSELLELLHATRQVPIAPVNSLSEFYQDPQVLHNETIFTIEDSKTGPVRQIKSMSNLNGSAPPRKNLAPRHGEQSREILNELGHSPTQIEALISQGIVTAFE